MTVRLDYSEGPFSADHSPRRSLSLEIDSFNPGEAQAGLEAFATVVARLAGSGVDAPSESAVDPGPQ